MNREIEELFPAYVPVQCYIPEYNTFDAAILNALNPELEKNWLKKKAKLEKIGDERGL